MRNRLKGVLLIGVVLTLCISGWVSFAGMQEKEEAALTPRQFLENFNAKKYTGEALDFDLKDADLKKVFNFVSRVSGFTFEIEEGIEGVVSLKEYMIPWDKALSIFLEQNSLGITLEGEEGSEKFIVRKKEVVKEEREE